MRNYGWREGGCLRIGRVSGHQEPPRRHGLSAWPRLAAPITAAVGTGSRWLCRSHPAHSGCIQRWAVPRVGSSSSVSWCCRALLGSCLVEASGTHAPVHGSPRGLTSLRRSHGIKRGGIGVSLADSHCLPNNLPSPPPHGAELLPWCKPGIPSPTSPAVRAGARCPVLATPFLLPLDTVTQHGLWSCSSHLTTWGRQSQRNQPRDLRVIEQLNWPVSSARLLGLGCNNLPFVSTTQSVNLSLAAYRVPYPLSSAWFLLVKPQDKTSWVANSVSPYEWEHFFAQLKFMLVILKNNHLNIYDPQFYITSLS